MDVSTNLGLMLGGHLFTQPRWQRLELRASAPNSYPFPSS